MKLSALLLLFFNFSVAAGVLAQKIELKVEGAPFKSVLREVQRQSDYSFFIKDKYIQEAKAVTIDIKDMDIMEVLPLLFAGQPFGYSIKGKVISAVSLSGAKEESKTKKVPLLQDTIRGTVTDSLGSPLAGVAVRIVGTNRGTNTNSQGRFQFNEIPENARLSFHSLGYSDLELAPLPDMTVQLSAALGALSEVQVSSGYQALPRERATGSFSQVDNELFNRPVSTDVMTRLADVMPGVIFNKGVGAAQGLVIRGQTSINYITSLPLIIVDNFPYENDINNINPNDVESVTVLKDAAAASIWGARAGNGVIVITTKSGRNNQRPQLSFNSNVTIGDKPNVFYHPRMSTANFIENEKRLFAEDFYEAGEQNWYSMRYPLTPVVELLIARRNGTMDSTIVDATIESWKDIDVRNDYEKYLFQQSVNQQYALNLSGGNDNQRYLLSLGYDRNRENQVGNGYERITLNANNTYSFFKKKLDFTTGIYYTNSKGNTTISEVSNNYWQWQPTYTTQDGAPGTSLYPYARLADENGNALPVTNAYRQNFLQTAEQRGLLDWQYRPLDEINLADNVSKITDYRLNAILNYKIMTGLSAELLYQYSRSITGNRNHYSQDTYFARDMVNQFSRYNTATGDITRAVPIGGILDRNNNDVYAHNLRGQLNFNRSFGTAHELNAIGGYEIRNQRSLGSSSRLYGYDDVHATGQLVDYVNLYPTYIASWYTLRISNRDAQTDLTDRFISYYANAGYTYRNRYLLSGSLRFDRSNLFGVRTNQKGVPLYSVGMAWTLNEEDFYRVDWLPYLRLRATYGSSGNVNRNLSALTTAYYSQYVDPLTGQQYASISNPPNPDLRWERIKTGNLGLDFGLLQKRIEGSVEYYHKRGYDIIGTTPYPGQTGVKSFTGNYANTVANGWDVLLNSQNLVGQFSWTSNLQFSYVTDKVTKYTHSSTTDGFTLLSGSAGMNRTPYEGKPLFAIYSYQWAGLDPENGDPMGYLNGEVSKDWEGIFYDISNHPENLIYHGAARPKVFGALRNTFSYKNFSLSANISYRFAYYFRRQSVNFYSISRGELTHGDYNLRWQQPGDESNTIIPSAIELTDNFRGGYFVLAEPLVEKGDHIRLQDITFSYSLKKTHVPSLPFQNIQLYLYANNLGIIWKATDSYVDPDYYQSDFPPARTIALGLKVDF